MPRVIISNDSRIPLNAELLKIDNNQIDDFLDFYFYNDTTKSRTFLFSFNGGKVLINLKSGENFNIELEEPKYYHCENDCDFCFVKGLPKGLRKKVYFRDDDYRLSFLFGNFLSLTNVSDDDIKRISRLRLSPLYVSVHTTNPALRKRLFKNEKAGMIMDQLKKLINNNIKIHCQIVVIPGLTDGENIINTVNDLSKLYPGISSVGIVPVGRTKFLPHIPGVTVKLAKWIIKNVSSLHKNFKKRYKKGFVYLADEFYIMTKTALPEASFYDNFPQYENGIGMVRQLLDEIDALRPSNRISGKFLFATGKLAYPYINYLKEKLLNKKCDIDVVCVTNKFFGNSITVSGLLLGNDIYAVIRKIDKQYDRIILPPNCVNDQGKFLDDYKFDKIKYLISPYSIKELILCLQ